MSRKTYAHYLVHIIREAWQADHYNIYVPLCLIGTTALGIAVMIAAFYASDMLIATIEIISGGLIMSWFIWLLPIVNWIAEKDENYKRWKKSFQFSTNEKTETEK